MAKATVQVMNGPRLSRRASRHGAAVRAPGRSGLGRDRALAEVAARLQREGGPEQSDAVKASARSSGHQWFPLAGRVSVIHPSGLTQTVHDGASIEYANAAQQEQHPEGAHRHRVAVRASEPSCAVTAATAANIHPVAVNVAAEQDRGLQSPPHSTVTTLAHDAERERADQRPSRTP